MILNNFILAVYITEKNKKSQKVTVFSAKL